MMMTKQWWLGCGAMWLTAMAMAQEPAAAPVSAASGGATAAWDVQLTPYVWGTGMGGTVRPYQGAPTGHVSESLPDVLKDLDAAFFVNAIVRKDAWVLHLDMTRASLSKSASVALAPGLNVDGQAKIRQHSFGVLGGYRWQQSAQSAWDWMAGVRNWDMHIQLRASAPGVGTYATSVDKTLTYPVVAARWRYQLNERWSSLLYADAGTRGRSGNYTWQGMLALNYMLRQQWYLSVGYRYLQLNYDKRGTQIDLAQQGPLLGVTYRF